MPTLTTDLPNDVAEWVASLPADDRADFDQKIREVATSFAIARNAPIDDPVNEEDLLGLGVG